MIQNISVIGAGTMGHSIAENFAIYGYPVALFDTNEEYLLKLPEIMRRELAILEQENLLNGLTVEQVIANITLYSDLRKSVVDADYVIEAIPENIELKRELFAALDGYCKNTTIFASNTSSLTLAEMMVSVSDERKKRMLICHWYNPGLLIPIAELSFFGNMPEEIYADVAALYVSIKKQVVKVLKEVPGLVANRIQQGIAREVFSLMAEGVASPEDIDKALMFGPAFRYATTGQLQIADFGGLDIWCTVGDNLLAVMDNSTEANPLLREKVEKQELGYKTGKGFFDYTKVDAEEIKKKYTLKLIHQLKASDYYM
jgi:3-hydroxybutyryl-CoA dehydrogenase